MDRRIQLVKRKLYIYIFLLLVLLITVGEVALQLTFLWIYFVKILFPFCCLDFKEYAFS